VDADEHSIACDFSSYNPTKRRKLQITELKTPPELHPHCAPQGKKAVVRLRLLVRRDGVVERSCFVTGDPICGPLLANAAREWRFKPWGKPSEPLTYAVHEETIRVVRATQSQPSAVTK
jgi:hypothetical protein